MTVSELVSALGAVSSESKELYKQYKEAKEKEDALRAALTAQLHESGLLTAKTPDYTASISIKKSVAVTDESAAIGWLKESGLEVDHYVGLRLTNFKTMANAMLKDTGEIVPGTELQESESLAIRANKK